MTRKNPLSARSAGLLLHPTSLPGPLSVGDLGPGARTFVDFLARAGQTFWQMLPIHPVGGGYSPYDSPSAFAGWTLLVSLEDAATDGLLEPNEIPREAAGERASYATAIELHDRALRLAFQRFRSPNAEALRSDYERYLAEHGSWVWDYALFCALKAHAGGSPWWTWDPALRHRDPEALGGAHERFRDEIAFHLFAQFLFERQWTKLRAYATARKVSLLGDIPMFVAHDSVDVWANQHLFFLDAEGNKTVQAGVPPDYFSEDGQLWGNPLYRWDVLRQDGYGWWIDRLRKELLRFDAVRIDHFIAFSRYWEVPTTAKTAKEGRYVEAPGHDFFERTAAALGGLPFIAEDLGILTREVEHLRDRFELPGMKILQFAFSPGAEGYLPHRHTERGVVYTGTHDNNTTRGFVDALAKKAETDESARVEYARLCAFAGTSAPALVTDALVRALYASVARVAILPVQDVLGQGERFRMNVPGIAEGNWNYRVDLDLLTVERAERLRALAEVTERLPE